MVTPPGHTSANPDCRDPCNVRNGFVQQCVDGDGCYDCGVVTTLLSKGLIAQTPDADDQRQHILRLTRAGQKLWQALPNPVEIILQVAFQRADSAEMEVARKVLQTAAKRLNEHDWEGE